MKKSETDIQLDAVSLTPYPPGYPRTRFDDMDIHYGTIGINLIKIELHFIKLMKHLIKLNEHLIEEEG